MFEFNVGDKVVYTNRFYTCVSKKGEVVGIEHSVWNNSYDIKLESGSIVTAREDELFLIKNKKVKMNDEKEKVKMNNEEKELKKDVEILLGIYLNNRDMNKKEIKRFSERHFDIIEKQNAKRTLKRRGK